MNHENLMMYGLAYLAGVVSALVVQHGLLKPNLKSKISNFKGSVPAPKLSKELEREMWRGIAKRRPDPRRHN